MVIAHYQWRWTNGSTMLQPTATLPLCAAAPARHNIPSIATMNTYHAIAPNIPKLPDRPPATLETMQASHRPHK
eukprot:664088-Prorocentrum_lima.AAC.1